MFKLILVTPEKKVVLGAEIEQVTVPAYRGMLNILPGHKPMITSIDTGIMNWKIKGEDKTYKAVISCGYCEVHPQGVDILAESLQMSEEINADESKKTIVSAEKKMATELLSDEEFEHQIHELARARSSIDLLANKA
jgi:F-type H+-transporting ATPase subunit epsilon